MGGYGAASGRVKDKCYYDSGNHKVTDKNAIIVAEKYIKEGKYVVFLQEKPNQHRADLSVDGVHTEVKGLTSLNSDNIEGKIKDAFIQIHGDDYKYPPEKRREGKVILLSNHDKSVSKEKIVKAMKKGYEIAKRKGEISGKIEIWVRDEIIKLN